MELKVLKDKRFPLVMVSIFIWGIVAHGMMLFNKFSYHDDALWVDGFNDIDTYGLGRKFGLCAQPRAINLTGGNPV